MMNESEFESALAAERECVEAEAYELRCSLGSGYGGVSPSGLPALLFPLGHGALPAGRRMGQVRTSFLANVSFLFNNCQWTQSAAVVECLDRRLIKTFCCLGIDLSKQFSGTLSARQVVEALRSWDDLLRRQDQLSDAEELGLWGELTVLLMCHHTDRAVSAWHGPASHTMDFHGGGVAIECKTSVHRRRHQVSLDQAQHVGDVADSYLISLWVQEDSNGGQTLNRLIESAATRVSDSVSLRKKLLQVGYREEHEYTRGLALIDAPRLYRIAQIPKVREWDQGVSKIKYEVDLSRLPPLGNDVLARVLERLCGEEQNDEQQDR